LPPRQRQYDFLSRRDERPDRDTPTSRPFRA
jgi:hypothetical protein